MDKENQWLSDFESILLGFIGDFRVLNMKLKSGTSDENARLKIALF